MPIWAYAFIGIYIILFIFTGVIFAAKGGDSGYDPMDDDALYMIMGFFWWITWFVILYMWIKDWRQSKSQHRA